ncbi:MAG TPA: DNA mismatch repair protein MutS, partial [Chloroflexia bacterium]|nr:DNA mismatch repair protein MutS [Chloroflexia bacterium]
MDAPRGYGYNGRMTPTETYQTRSARFAQQRDSYTSRWNQIGNIRLLTFVAAATAGGVAIWRNLPLAGIVAAGLLVAFVALVRHHRRLGRERRRYTVLYQINDEAAKRLARDWEHVPLRHTVQAPADHPYAADLDIFGRASLFHLLEAISTRTGETTLAGWLLAPAPPATVRERQPAVAELAPLIDLRDELALRGRLMGDPSPDPEPFLAWAESEPLLRRHARLVWAGRISVALLWGLLAAQLTGLTPHPIWLIFAAVNGVLARVLLPAVGTALESIAAREGAFAQYAESFELLADAAFAAPLLRHIQSELRAGDLTAHEQMRRLHRRATLGFPHDSSLYIPIQILTLWDIQVLSALESWQAVAGLRARSWVMALGEADALASLAVQAHDNPDWCFPTIGPEASALSATGLAHPLLQGTTRVANDVTVGPAGTFLLVTGSNMSGKSTLLRAVGVNLVLAGAGGPVCATTFAAPPVALWTSMRIQDSLERGVSYFMAELQRLKAVVDATRDAPAGQTPFYLLDEILQGTNTAER